jgi:hypothetical protein
MAKENKDKSVLNHIDQLVKEEERLYGKGQLNASDQKRLAELKVQLDQFGICCGSAAHSKSSAKILIKRKNGPPKLLKTMSSRTDSSATPIITIHGTFAALQPTRAPILYDTPGY